MEKDCNIIPLTEEEIAEIKATQAIYQQQLEAIDQKELVKASAIEKLQKLGLTEEEAKAIVGL